MSENTGSGNPVEVKSVASSPVPPVEAQIATMRDRAQDDRRSVRAESPFLHRVSLRRNPWPEVVAYDERVRELSQRVATLNDEIAALAPRRDDRDAPRRASRPHLAASGS